MDMQPVRLGSKTIHSQSVSKFGLGDRKKMYTKRARGGWIQFFTKIPRNLDLWMGKNGKVEKKCTKRKRNNVGSCPFLPMTCQNTDLGMGKCEKHLSEKCEKQIFVSTSFWSISKSLVYYHQISLAYAMPKHTSCYKRICSRLGSKTIFPKTCWNLDLGMEKMYIWGGGGGGNPIFYRSPGIWISGWEIFVRLKRCTAR